MNRRQTGVVVAAFGRQYRVSMPNGEIRLCVPRGKKSEVACGDEVDVSLLSDDAQGCIESIHPRRSLLYRSNEFRQKLIAANVTQVVLVVACEPPFSEDLLSRCLIAAEAQHLKTLIVLNKYDLIERRESADRALAEFERLGYRVLRLSAAQDVSALPPLLHAEHSLLVGQSGMGKSTLTNALIPEAKAKTREISEALQSGKHTTTFAMRYALDEASSLIDSPGLQEFGLSHLDNSEIEQAFPELRTLSGPCRFRNCRHRQEPDCAVRKAVDAGVISANRYRLLLTLSEHKPAF